MDTIEDRIRKQVEMCESLQGVIFHSSIAGGTGSGSLTTIMMQLGEDTLKSKVIVNNTIIPSNDDKSSSS